MKTSDLTTILRRMYETAGTGGQVTAIHLFGIRHADELRGQPLKEIAQSATGRESYQTEIRKGMNLARFVQVR